MQETIKDSTITLFGKKIPFNLEVPWTMSHDVIKQTQQHQGHPYTEKDFESSNPSVSSESGNPKTPSIDEETVKPKDSDKPTLKKPDKILACPRCKSMDTKFCYYNNYNVSQPRHFCKSCQRYWTSGGTMRNVPVGAGRRKSKTSAAAAGYPQICISDSRNHATVLSFSSDSKNQAMNRHVDDSSSESIMSENHNEELISHHQPPPWPPYNYMQGGVPFYQPFWTCHVPWNLPWPPPPYRYSCEEERPVMKKKKVGAPKTVRMDDPNEAAKSSIWETLGIKNDDNGVVPKGGGFFKGFHKTLIAADQGEEEENNYPSILCANPAAFSRSLHFHERHHE